MTIKVRYIGDDAAEIRKGDVYEVTEVKDSNRYYAVVDRSGEAYAYPKELFEVVGEFNGA